MPQQKEKDEKHHDPLLGATTVGAVAAPKPQPAPDLKDYEGQYYFQDTNEEEPYGLKKVPDDPWGRTHHLRNDAHSWAGTREEFKAHFDKEPKEKVDERKAKEQEKELKEKEKEREKERESED